MSAGSPPKLLSPEREKPSMIERIAQLAPLPLTMQVNAETGKPAVMHSVANTAIEITPRSEEKLMEALKVEFESRGLKVVPNPKTPPPRPKLPEPAAPEQEYYGTTSPTSASAVSKQTQLPNTDDSAGVSNAEIGEAVEEEELQSPQPRGGAISEVNDNAAAAADLVLTAVNAIDAAVSNAAVIDSSEKHAAATKLQAIQRGRQAKKQVQDKVEKKVQQARILESIPDDTAAHSAATKLQAVQRGRQAKKEVAGLRDNAAPAPLPSELSEPSVSASLLSTLSQPKSPRSTAESRALVMTDDVGEFSVPPVGSGALVLNSPPPPRRSPSSSSPSSSSSTAAAAAIAMEAYVEPSPAETGITEKERERSVRLRNDARARRAAEIAARKQTEAARLSAPPQDLAESLQIQVKRPKPRGGSDSQKPDKDKVSGVGAGVGVGAGAAPAKRAERGQKQPQPQPLVATPVATPQISTDAPALAPSVPPGGAGSKRSKYPLTAQRLAAAKSEPATAAPAPATATVPVPATVAVPVPVPPSDKAPPGSKLPSQRAKLAKQRAVADAEQQQQLLDGQALLRGEGGGGGGDSNAAKKGSPTPSASVSGAAAVRYVDDPALNAVLNDVVLSSKAGASPGLSQYPKLATRPQDKDKDRGIPGSPYHGIGDSAKLPPVLSAIPKARASLVMEDMYDAKGHLVSDAARMKRLKGSDPKQKEFLSGMLTNLTLNDELRARFDEIPMSDAVRMRLSPPKGVMSQAQAQAQAQEQAPSLGSSPRKEFLIGVMDSLHLDDKLKARVDGLRREKEDAAADGLAPASDGGAVADNGNANGNGNLKKKRKEKPLFMRLEEVAREARAEDGRLAAARGAQYRFERAKAQPTREEIEQHKRLHDAVVEQQQLQRRTDARRALGNGVNNEPLDLQGTLQQQLVSAVLDKIDVMKKSRKRGGGTARASNAAEEPPSVVDAERMSAFQSHFNSELVGASAGRKDGYGKPALVSALKAPVSESAANGGGGGGYDSKYQRIAKAEIAHKKLQKVVDEEEKRVRLDRKKAFSEQVRDTFLPAGGDQSGQSEKQRRIRWSYDANFTYDAPESPTGRVAGTGQYNYKGNFDPDAKYSNPTTHTHASLGGSRVLKKIYSHDTDNNSFSPVRPRPPHAAERASDANAHAQSSSPPLQSQSQWVNKTGPAYVREVLDDDPYEEKMASVYKKGFSQFFQ